MKEWVKKESERAHEPTRYERKDGDIRVELSVPFLKDSWEVKMYDGGKLVYGKDFKTRTDGSPEDAEKDLYKAQKKALWDLEQFCVDTKNHWKDTASIVYGMRLG